MVFISDFKNTVSGWWEGGSCLGTHVRIKDFKIKKKKLKINKNKNENKNTVSYIVLHGPELTHSASQCHDKVLFTHHRTTVCLFVFFNL